LVINRCLSSSVLLFFSKRKKQNKFSSEKGFMHAGFKPVN
jgi:hypothetical protein